MIVPSQSSGEAAAAKRSVRYRLGRLVRLVRKELTEILRDRRTITTLVVMPLLLYPLITMAFRVFYQSSHVGEVENLFRVCFDSETEAINTISFLEGKQRVKRLVYTTTMNAEEAVRKGDVDLVFHKKSKEGIVDRKSVV